MQKAYKGFQGLPLLLEATSTMGKKKRKEKGRRGERTGEERRGEEKRLNVFCGKRECWTKEAVNRAKRL